MRYLVITLDDAKAIARALDGDGPTTTIRARLNDDTGADMQEIVDMLTGLDTCMACEIEEQLDSCQSFTAQKLGRRLRRLLERARGERDLQQKAHGLVAYALKTGRLTKALACEGCSAIASVAPGGLVGHHADYSRPLSVEWLCRMCHGQRHAGDAR